MQVPQPPFMRPHTRHAVSLTEAVNVPCSARACQVPTVYCAGWGAGIHQRSVLSQLWYTGTGAAST